MDSQIYMLLASADKEKNVTYVRQAFEILDPNMSIGKEKSANDVENFSQNLYVECAEKAIYFQELAIANRCVQIYFSLPMIANQFLARAYLCQFELLAPKGTHQLENVEKSIPFLFKAIDYSRENKRYNFLIYNASVIFWKYARAFMKPTFKRHLCVSLQKIAQALREIDDPDYEWRVFLEKTLIEAHLDNDQTEEAVKLAESLLTFIDEKYPNYYDEFFEFMINHNLVTHEQIMVLLPTKWELKPIYRMEHLKLKRAPAKKEMVRLNSNLTSNKHSAHAAAADESSKYTELRDIINELDEIYRSILPSNTPSSNMSNNHFLKASSEDFIVTFKRQHLLLNLAHIALRFDEVNICSQILGYLKETELVNEEFHWELEFLEAEQLVKELKHKKEKYTKVVVKVRTECINKLYDTLVHVNRANNTRLCQQGCQVMWSLCLPLLQPGIRKQVRKALQLIVECLDNIDSMEWLLRCRVHFELAKCNEEIEQLQSAEHHLLKALAFDDGGIHKEQLLHSLNRLRLRAELYVTPELVDDQVGMILEQCVVGGKSEKRLKPAMQELVEALDSDTKIESGEINTHSLLLRAALLLAPAEYSNVLESETFRSNFGKLNEDQVTKLAKKALNHQNCVVKCSEHLNERLADLERNFQRRSGVLSPADPQEVAALLEQDYKVRLKLWLDLCRIARKQSIWDLCRVSCRFAVLYDREDLVKRFLSKGSLYDTELMRNLAEIHFIFGESMIVFIRNEGINLYERPAQPDMSADLKMIMKSKAHINRNDDSSDKSTLNVSRQSKMAAEFRRDFKTDGEWLEYVQWLEKLSKETMEHFLRGVEIGVELGESWLVSQGCAYAWNYIHHMVEKKSYTKVVNVLNTLLNALKKTGHNCEPDLCVAICVAYANGLMAPWLPVEQVVPLKIPGLEPKKEETPGEKGRKSAGAKKSTAAPPGVLAPKPFSIPPEATGDLKKALEICEYAMNITNGDNLADVVSLKDRFPLIKTWVLAKQMNQSAIKNFGISKVLHPDGIERFQDKYTKCMVTVEILNRNLKLPGGLATFEIKDAVSLKDLIIFVDQCYSWPDRLIELELWANIAVLANKLNQTDNLRYAHTKALETISYFEKNKKAENKVIYTTSQTLLCETCIALGEHLTHLINSPKQEKSKPEKGTNSSTSVSKLDRSQRDHSSTTTVMSFASTTKDTRVALKRDALNAFADACGYAANAESYELAMHAARHYWNLCMPYLSNSEERGTLYENLQEILQALQIVYKFKPKEEVKSEDADLLEEEKKNGEEPKKDVDEESPTNKKSTALTTTNLLIKAKSGFKKVSAKKKTKEIAKPSTTNQESPTSKKSSVALTTANLKNRTTAISKKGSAVGGYKMDRKMSNLENISETASKKPPTAAKSNAESKGKTPASATPSAVASRKLDKISESQNSNVNNTTAISDQFLDSTIGVDAESPAEKPFDPLEDRFDDLTLRCVLYACHFQILIDRQDFEDALEQMEQALTDLPRTKHRMLIYRIKVITKSKLGLDVQMDLQKFQEDSEKSLAQMYRKVALSSLKHSDTINSYQRAIEGLSSDASLWLKIEYIMEFAQWMYSNEYALTTCTDLVEWAIDLLMFKVRGERITRGTSASTVASRSGKVAKITKLNKKQTNNPLTFVPESINEDDSGQFVADISQNLVDEMLAVEKSVVTKQEDNFFDTPIYNKNINWNDLQDIKQLEGLIRSHTVLAIMLGHASPEYTGHLLKAYYSLYRLFWQAVENGLHSIKEVAKVNAALEAAAAQDKKKSNAPPPDGKKTATGATKSKNMKIEAGASGYIPQTLEQWSLFDVGEDMLNAWTHELMNKIGINQTTVVEPYLLFYYLDLLGKMLAEQGYSNLLFPIYNLQVVLVNTVLKQDFNNSTSNKQISLNCYVRLKLINLCVELNCIQGVAFHQQLLTDLIIPADPLNPLPGSNSNPSNLLKLLQLDPLEACIVREQIFQKNQSQSHMQEEEAILKAQSSLSFSVCSSKMGSIFNKSMNNFNKSQMKKTHRTAKIRIADGSVKKWKKFKSEDIRLPGENRPLHGGVSDMLYQDMWLAQADTLIESGYFQTARDFLYESLNACKIFEEKYTLAKVQYLLAKIALFDCNFIEARNHASQAQKVAIDEKFWYNCICVLVDSFKYDHQDKQAYDKCLQILNKALRLVKAEKTNRPNKASSFEYMIGMFEYQYAQITADGLLTGKLNDGDLTRQQKMGRRCLKQNTMHLNYFKKFTTVCEMYEASAQILKKNSFKREAVNVLRSHARLLQTFASDSNNLESKHDYFLQSWKLLNESLDITNELWVEVGALQQLNDTQNISFPIQRELVDIKLEMTQLLTDMLEVNLNEIKFKNAKNLQQNIILKTYESFISSDDNLSQTEQNWIELSSQLPDLIFGNLTSCHNLSFKIKQFRTQSLFLIGRTYRLISELKIQLRKSDLNDKTMISMTLPMSKWSPLIMEIIKAQQLAEAESNNKSKGAKTNANASQSKSNATLTSQSYMAQSDNHETSTNPDGLNPLLDVNSETLGSLQNSNLQLLLEQDNFKNLLVSINQTEAQAMESLLQALNIAFVLENKEYIRDITYEIIELIGRLDLQVCTQFIALYQTCSNSIEIEQVIEKSSLDPKNSLLVSFLHQMKFFQSKSVTQNILNSPIIKQTLDATKLKFNAFKYLNPTINHFNLSKDLPANYLVLVMQHNKAKTELYGSILEKPTVVQGKVSRATFQNSIGINLASSKTTAIKIKTDPFELYHLQQQWKDWKANLQAFNLKIEFQLNNDLIQRTPGEKSALGLHENISELMQIYLNSSNPKFDEMYQMLVDIENKFDFLVNKTEAYLKPITEFFEKYFYVPMQSVDPNTSPMPKPVDKVVLCADLDLLEFPLESIKIIHNNFAISTISRDFSIQFLSTRINLQKDCEMNFVTDKKDKKPETKTEKKPPVSLEALPEGAIVIDSAKCKYLVDAFDEASKGLPADYQPVSSFKKLLHTYSSFTGKWQGLTGSDHITSTGERERMLMESNCFVFHGTERFLSYFNSSKMNALNLNECRLLIINDLANTSESYSRIGKLDVFRNPGELECENPLEANILLTLAGVKSIMSNQWNSTLAENSEKLQTIFKDFFENRQSCGEAVRFRMSPHIKKILSDAMKKEEELKNAVADTKSKTDKKKDSETAVAKDAKTPKHTAKPEEVVDAAEKEKEEARKAEEEEKKAQFLKSLERLRRENFNMVLYGIPDIYMSS